MFVVVCMFLSHSLF